MPTNIQPPSELTNFTEQEAYDFCIEVAGEFKAILKSSFALMAKLYLVKTLKLYEGQWDSWENFLDENNLDTVTGNKFVRIYERFVVQFQIPIEELEKVGNWTKLDAVMKYAQDPTKALEALKQAETLPTRSSLRKWLKEAVEDDFTPCSHPNCYTVSICKDCGERFGTYINI